MMLEEPRIHALGDPVYPSLEPSRLRFLKTQIPQFRAVPLDRALIRSTSSRPASAAWRFPATRALQIPNMQCAGTDVPSKSKYAAMGLSPLLTNCPSHIRLSKLRVLVSKASEITTSRSVPNSREYERTLVLQAPAQPRRETYGLLIAQPGRCSGPTSLPQPGGS